MQSISMGSQISCKYFCNPIQTHHGATAFTASHSEPGKKKHAPSHVFKVLLSRGVAGMMYVNVCKSP